MKKIKDIFWIVLVIFMMGSIIYKIRRNYIANHISQSNAIHIKAVIIDDRNYMGNQRVKPEFTYSYQFIVNGEKYKGDSHDLTLKVGDTVEVEYDKKHPNINKPLHPKN